MKIRISKNLLSYIREDVDKFGVDFCIGKYSHNPHIPDTLSYDDFEDIILNIQDNKFSATDLSYQLFEIELSGLHRLLFIFYRY